MEQILLDAVLRHREDGKVILDTWHSFTKGRSCLTGPVAFCDGVAPSVGKEKMMDAIPLDFCKVFDTVLHAILLSKL